MQHDRNTMPVMGLLAMLSNAAAGLACTTIIVTPGASVSGAMFVTHSDDGHICDARLAYVPAADHEPGSRRPVYYDVVSIGELPGYASFVHNRYAGSSRGPDYAAPGEPQSKPIGFIPQAPHTYGYFDGNYAIMNERPLSVYYCTCITVCEGRNLPDPIGGILWYGNGKPAETCLTPFYAGITGIAGPYKTCDPRVFSRDSAFWAFKFVENWAALNYQAIHADIVARRQALEQEAFQAVSAADAQALKLYQQDPAGARAWLTEFSMHSASNTFLAWQRFGDLLVARYADGGLNEPAKLNQKKGYPKDWLMKTSWPEGPIKYEK